MYSTGGIPWRQMLTIAGGIIVAAAALGVLAKVLGR